VLPIAMENSFLKEENSDFFSYFSHIIVVWRSVHNLRPNDLRKFLVFTVLPIAMENSFLKEENSDLFSYH